MKTLSMVGGCILAVGSTWAEMPTEIKLELNAPKIVFIETYRASLVDPFDETYAYGETVSRKVIPNHRKSWPMIDGPGPGYRKILKPESSRPNS
jgi:hypothetical protein